jgi:hypothetical protein
MKKRLPPKTDRLPPNQLGKLFGFLSADYEDLAHPGVPLSAEGRRKTLQSMSGKEMRRSYDQVYVADSVRYEKATSYGIDERVSFEHGVVLITGTRWPKEALTRLRAMLSFGIILPAEQRVPFKESELDKRIAHRSVEALARLQALLSFDTSLEAKPERRRRFQEREIDEFIDWWRLRGFSRTELITWAAIVSEAIKAKTAAARSKNLAKARKTQLTLKVRRRTH